MRKSHILAGAEAAARTSACSASPPLLGWPGGGDRHTQKRGPTDRPASAGYVASSAVVGWVLEAQRHLSALVHDPHFVEQGAEFWPRNTSLDVLIRCLSAVVLIQTLFTIHVRESQSPALLQDPPPDTSAQHPAQGP